MKYDVLIIGAGPIGLACGIEAQQRELTHRIVEKGCLVNSIFHYPVNMTFFSTSDKLEIGGVPFISHGSKPTRREALEYYRRAAEIWELNVNTYERVLDVKGTKGDFSVLSEKRTYDARFVIVATGYYDNPNFLGIPGEELPKVRHYYNEPHPYAGQKVAVIGTANSAVDVALELFRVGADVTMIVREPTLWEGIKYWVKPDIENRIENGEIRAYFNSTVTKIAQDSIDILVPEGEMTIENDYVMAMTGYHFDHDFLKGIGVAFADDRYMTPACDPESLETNRDGVFLAGVVCGGMETSKLFIENSREHALRIFEAIQQAKK